MSAPTRTNPHQPCRHRGRSLSLSQPHLRADASDCESRAGPVPLGFTVGGNGVYSSKGNVTVCEQRGKPGGKYNLTTWVKMGHDAGSFEAPHPTDETMASWIKAKLGF